MHFLCQHKWDQWMRGGGVPLLFFFIKLFGAAIERFNGKLRGVCKRMSVRS